MSGTTNDLYEGNAGMPPPTYHDAYLDGVAAERARIEGILNDAAGLEMPYEHLVDRDDLLAAIQKGNA